MSLHSFYWVNVMCHIMRELQYISQLQHEGVRVPIYSTEGLKEIWWTEHLPLCLGKRQGSDGSHSSGHGSSCSWWSCWVRGKTQGGYSHQPTHGETRRFWLKNCNCWWRRHASGKTPGIPLLEKLFRQAWVGERINQFLRLNDQSFIIYIPGGVGEEGSVISNYMWKLDKKWTVERVHGAVSEILGRIHGRGWR